MLGSAFGSFLFGCGGALWVLFLARWWVWRSGRASARRPAACYAFRLHPVDRRVGGMLPLPATPKVIAGLVAAAEAAPEELSAITNSSVGA